MLVLNLLYHLKKGDIMCLSMGYLNQRDRVARLYSFFGYKGLYEIGISIDSLIKAGLLAEHERMNTAMIDGLMITKKGRRVFTNVGYQLILLKPNAFESLNYYIEDISRVLPSKHDYLFDVLVFIPRIVLLFFPFFIFKRVEF